MSDLQAVVSYLNALPALLRDLFAVRTALGDGLLENGGIGDQARDTFIPDGVQVTVTRNYGRTADQKAKKLITKLIFATASVVVLVLLAQDWSKAVIVGAAVVVTLAITLFASWAWGFTLNRASLFALILSP